MELISTTLRGDDCEVLLVFYIFDVLAVGEVWIYGFNASIWVSSLYV